MSSIRAARRCGSAGAIVLAVLCAPAPAASASAAPAYSQGNQYRHGVVPPLGQQRTAAALAAGPLLYGGGVGGVGVTTGAPRVYLVFWGSQWGVKSTNAQGYVTLAGDPKGMAPARVT
jgi:hypothetical protein